MKKYIYLAPILLSFFGFTCNEKIADITSKEIQDHITVLASDDLAGRYTGTEEAEAAALYIQNDLEENGLKPAFKDGFYQHFPIIKGYDYPTTNQLTFSLNKAVVSTEKDSDFVVYSYSGNVSIKDRNLVFAGYGINAPELKYNDYENIDVKGKVVVVFKLTPDEENPHSGFSKYSDNLIKAKTAKDAGALGIIFVNTSKFDGIEDKLSTNKVMAVVNNEDFGAIQVKRSIINHLLKEEGKDLTSIQKNIDNDKKPNSFLLNNCKINLTTEVIRLEETGINVAAILEGKDPKLADEYIVIGGHYDHIGWGETGSLYRGNEKQIHNGADDNASGTAAVLELAEKFSFLKNNKRSIIFAAFAGEELGLLGSSYFVKNLPVPSDKIIAMLNFDMVGRLNDEKNLVVSGAGTSTVWKNLLNDENKDFNFKLSLNDDGYGGSDHSSFYSQKIPVLFFFTGLHDDYHRPTDDPEKINAAGQEQVVNYAYNIAYKIVNEEKKPDYVNVPRKDSGRGFKVYVGTIPDYTAQANGFRISGVNEGSPAQKAGLKEGDIITNFGGKKVGDIYDYTKALGDFSPGQEIDIEIMRDGKPLKLKLKLGSR